MKNKIEVKAKKILEVPMDFDGHTFPTGMLHSLRGHRGRDQECEQVFFF